MADDTDRLQLFEQGGAIEVPVGRIEAELAALWRRAAEARPGQIPKAVTRACLWNLVVRVRGEAEFVHAKKVIDDLAQRIPARTIVMRIEPDQPDSLRAWVEANWRRSEGGGPASGSDEVTLWASGKAAERVPSLVRSLLYTDAPTAMFWTAALPSTGPLVRELVHQADRLIVDTRKLDDERGLAELCALGQKEPELRARRPVVDRHLAAARDVRGAVRSAARPERAAQLDRVRVVSNIQGTQARGLLALGWLDGAARLEAAEAAATRPRARGAGRRRGRTASR